MSMLTPSGEFDRLMTIELNTPARDATMGGELPSWATWADVWARIREKPVETAGSTGAPAGLDAGQRMAAVRIRYLEGVDPARMRLREGSTLWRITGLAVLGRNAELDLTVRDWSHD